MSDNEATSYELLTAATAPGNSSVASLGSDVKAVQVKSSTTAGAGSTTVIVEVTNDTTWPWLTAATITLVTGTVEVSDGIVLSAGWKFLRARVSAISGTGAQVSANVGV